MEQQVKFHYNNNYKFTVVFNNYVSETQNTHSGNENNENETNANENNANENNEVVGYNNESHKTAESPQEQLTSSNLTPMQNTIINLLQGQNDISNPKIQIECPKCEFEFDNDSDLNNHMILLHDNLHLNFDSTTDSILEHKTEVIQEPKLDAQSNLISFSNHIEDNHAANHAANHADDYASEYDNDYHDDIDEIYHCFDCNYETSSKYNYDDHKYHCLRRYINLSDNPTHAQNNYSYVRGVYTNSLNYKDQMKKKYKNKNKKNNNSSQHKISCPVCERQFASQYHLGDHFIFMHNNYTDQLVLDIKKQNTSFPGHDVLVAINMISYPKLSEITKNDQCCMICTNTYKYAEEKYEPEYNDIMEDDFNFASSIDDIGIVKQIDMNSFFVDKKELKDFKLKTHDDFKIGLTFKEKSILRAKTEIKDPRLINCINKFRMSECLPVIMNCCQQNICTECIKLNIMNTDSIICLFCKKDHTRTDLDYIKIVEITDEIDSTRWDEWWKSHMHIFY